MPHDESDSLERDLEATVAARADLGREYEPALVESFLERIDAQVEKRVQTELKAQRSDGSSWDPRTFAMGTLGIGVPLTAIAGGIADLPGIIVAWAGIVGVNLAAAWGSRRRR